MGKAAELDPSRTFLAWSVKLRPNVARFAAGEQLGLSVIVTPRPRFDPSGTNPWVIRPVRRAEENHALAAAAPSGPQPSTLN